MIALLIRVIIPIYLLIMLYLYVKVCNGLFGIDIALKLLNRKNYKVLKNFDFYGKNSENYHIDYLVLSVHGVFIINVIKLFGKIYGKENDRNWMHIYRNKETLIPNYSSQITQITKEIGNMLDLGHGKALFIPILVIKNARLNISTGTTIVRQSKLTQFIKMYNYIFPITNNDMCEMINKIESVNINENGVIVL